jgi:hypothetical protein
MDGNTKFALSFMIGCALLFLALIAAAIYINLFTDVSSATEDNQNSSEDDSDDGGNMRRKPPPEPPKGPGGCSVQLTKAQKAHDFRLRG